jgi:DNA-binding response OmpR family regulator
MNPRVLIVDDDERWRISLSDTLQREDFEVVGASTGSEAVQLVHSNRFDLVILDVQLKGMDGIDGYDVCLEIRKRHDYIPIIMISGVKKEVIDRLLGLRMGADRYFEKPTEPEEIVAQVRALLRLTQAVKSSRASSGWLQIDDYLRLNLEMRAVMAGGQSIDLTPKEFDLLRYLVEHAGASCSRADIIDHVWKDDNPEGVSNNAIDTMINRLRQKIEPESKPHYILTIHGLGYRFRGF